MYADRYWDASGRVLTVAGFAMPAIRDVEV